MLTRKLSCFETALNETPECPSIYSGHQGRGQGKPLDSFNLDTKVTTMENDGRKIDSAMMVQESKSANPGPTVVTSA